MKLAKREKYILYGVMVLLFALVLERLIFNPLSERLWELNQQINAEEAKLIRGLRAEKQKDRIISEYQSYEKYLKLKGSDEEVVSEYLREIEKLARESAVSVSYTKPQLRSERGIYKEYTVDVRAAATLENTITFLYNLNSSNLLLRVEKFTLSLEQETDTDLKLNLVISGMFIP